MRDYALVLLVTAAVTYLLTPLVRRVAVATHAIHEPRARDTHTEPTPLLGGLAMYGGLAAGLLIASPLSSPARSLPDGRVEDRGRAAAGRRASWSSSGSSTTGGGSARSASWPARWRRPGILVWSGQALPWLPHAERRRRSLLGSDLSVTLTILLIVVTINAINFIDGLDGLAAGIVAVAALSILVFPYTLVRTIGNTAQSLPAVASALLAGMCIGFLPQLLPGPDLHGRHRRDAARSAARLRADIQYRFARPGPADQLLRQPRPGPVPPRLLPLLVPAAIFVIPYADLMFAIIRRTRAGKPLMVADRQHLHHRLMNIGHSYRKSVLLMYLWAALFSVAVVSLSLVRSPLIVFAAATLVAVLALLAATMPRMRPWHSGPARRPVSGRRRARPPCASDASGAPWRAPCIARTRARRPRTVRDAARPATRAPLSPRGPDSGDPR